MYKVTRIERFNDSVFVDDFKFNTREEAEQCFTENAKKDCVVDITLFYCIPYGEEKELTRQVRHGFNGTRAKEKALA